MDYGYVIKGTLLCYVVAPCEILSSGVMLLSHVVAAKIWFLESSRSEGEILKIVPRCNEMCNGAATLGGKVWESLGKAIVKKFQIPGNRAISNLIAGAQSLKLVPNKILCGV